MSLYVVLIPALLSGWLVPWLLIRRHGVRLLDHPNERSLHDRPVPRGGGLGMLLALVPVVFWLPGDSDLASVLLMTLGLGVFSFVDDLRPLPAAPRFLVQGLLAGWLISKGLTLDRPLPLDWHLPEVVAVLIAWLFVVWMTNLYNFMDGMDGFAGGMALFGFGTLGMLGWLGGDQEYALVAGAVALASAGFLYFNFPPARIFMGDVGSVALGFLAAALILYGSRQGLFPFWTGVLVFSPFVVDATVTLLRRAWRRERLWQAHRTHYYQRLVQAGWGHRRTVLVEYLLMLLCALAAFLLVRAGEGAQQAAFLLWMLLCGIIVALAEWYLRKGDAS